MKKRIASVLGLAALLSLAALPAAAECFADYKAKRDDPLRLHYGVIALPDAACSDRQSTGKEIAARIGVDGWTLLSVVSVFDRSGLDDEKRRESAGVYFLRY